MGFCKAFSVGALGTLLCMAGVFAAMSVYYDGVDSAFLAIMPMVPSHWFQNAGGDLAAVVVANVLPVLRNVGVLHRPIDCRKPGSDHPVLVLVSTNKGGSILGARFAAEVMFRCGMNFALGRRINDQWPPPVDLLPTRQADILIAVGNLNTWPEYARRANRPQRCVVVARDPFGRFRSMYMYAVDGGESGLVEIGARLRPMNFSQGVDMLFKEMGKQTLEVTHANLVASLRFPGCANITFERLTSDFESAAKDWLEAWDLNPQVIPDLLQRVTRHDARKLSEVMRNRDAHLTSFKWTSAEKKRLDDAIWSNAELSQLIKKQRAELGYP